MRVLVLGGTGAMGTHVCRLLAKVGNDVTVTTRRRRTGDDLAYEVGDAKDRSFLEPLLARGWDAVVDFMVWSTQEFAPRFEGMLLHADQYVFLSSYRVYADTRVIKEESPRLLDVSLDDEYLATDEYALSKARCENLLFGSGRRNWTVVRPAITYDGAVGRLQLGVAESREWLWRAANGIPVPLPESMLARQATMTWGGDVARMICALVGNPAALGQAFTASTSDHMSWAEVAKAYGEVVPLEVRPCGEEEYVRARGGKYQLVYDRLFDRVIDNSKILAATGLDSSELVAMREGLPRELNLSLHLCGNLTPSAGMNARLDYAMGGTTSLLRMLRDSGIGWPIAMAKYATQRFIAL